MVYVQSLRIRKNECGIFGYSWFVNRQGKKTDLVHSPGRLIFLYSLHTMNYIDNNGTNVSKKLIGKRTGFVF